jgi:alcohol dehydrogenase
MSDLSFQVPADVRLGLDVVNRTASIISQYGDRAILVTEAILYEGRIIERVQGLLERRGIQSIVFDEVVPNATSSAVDEGVRLARGAHAQIVIGLGGVRTLSTAKCIAMVTPLDIEMDDILSGVQPREKPLAYVGIPTTCRDPFLLTDEYLITDSRDRSAKVGRTQNTITRAVLLDPKLTVTLPAKYTATTLMDTLLSAVEGYLSSRSNFLADTFFLRAIEMIGSTIRPAVEQPEDLRARIQASMAGLLTGLGLSMSKQGVGAALVYALNARYMVPKSWLSCILLPHVMEFHLNSATEKLAAVASLLGEARGATGAMQKLEASSFRAERGASAKQNRAGQEGRRVDACHGGRSGVDAGAAASAEAAPAEASPAEVAGLGIETVRRLIHSLGLPTRLRDFDLNLDDMVDIAGTARSYDMMNYLPRAVSTEDLYELIKIAY